MRTDEPVVRAAAARLAPHSRRDPSKRQARRDFHRTMIAHHTKAQSARARVSPLTRPSAHKDVPTQKSLAPRRALCFTEDFMTNYATPTVVPQTIPNDDMTPLERLLLTNIFDADDINGEHYFYAENPLKPCLLSIKRTQRRDRRVPERPSSALPAIQEQLSHCEPGQSIIYLDLSGSLGRRYFKTSFAVPRHLNTFRSSPPSPAARCVRFSRPSVLSVQYMRYLRDRLRCCLAA